jgi:predicted nucleic acid-binding protein
LQPNSTAIFLLAQKPLKLAASQTQTQPRIAVEAEAVLTILHLVELGKAELFASDVLFYEVNRTPNLSRKTQVLEILKLATHVIPLNEPIERIALLFADHGVKSLDAMHVASAGWAKVNFFCTCDDKLLKRRELFKSHGIEVLSPLHLVQEVAL